MDGFALETWTTEAPALVRVAVGVVGAIVLLWGARIYHPAVRLAAWGAGAVGAVTLLQALSPWAPELTRPMVLLVGAAVGGFAVLGVAVAAHKIALIGVGALSGAVAAASLVGPLALPMWAPVVGLVVGAVVLPLVFPLLLKVTTPLAGAALVAWAVARPTTLWVVAGLWLLGVVFQLGFVRSRPKEEEA